MNAARLRKLFFRVSFFYISLLLCILSGCGGNGGGYVGTRNNSSPIFDVRNSDLICQFKLLTDNEGEHSGQVSLVALGEDLFDGVISANGLVSSFSGIRVESIDDRLNYSGTGFEVIVKLNTDTVSGVSGTFIDTEAVTVISGVLSARQSDFTQIESSDLVCEFQ